MQPPLPSHIDVRSISDVPLDAAALMGAAMHDPMGGDAWRMKISLQAASWHQVPAASLPDEPLFLASLCGLGRNVTAFEGLREEVMQGFLLCDDGRLYHADLAVKAVAAWDRLCASGGTDVDEDERTARRRAKDAARQARRRARIAATRVVETTESITFEDVTDRDVTHVTRDADRDVRRDMRDEDRDERDVTRDERDAERDCHAPKRDIERDSSVTFALNAFVSTQSCLNVTPETRDVTPIQPEKPSVGEKEGRTIGRMEERSVLSFFSPSREILESSAEIEEAERCGEPSCNPSPSFLVQASPVTTKGRKADKPPKTPRTPRTKAPMRVWPIDTPFTDQALRFAAKHGLDEAEARWQWDRMLVQSASKGRPYANIELAFLNWITSAYFQPRFKAIGSGPNGAPVRDSPAARHALRLRREAEAYHASQASNPEIHDEPLAIHFAD